uniref:RNA-directed DNA polymerase, eukaryota, reverse transcriptase zinc-binding domain protein n=1 Tax=Tanacetum cinerariifolium TaxID=118510 RepID=A0A699HWV4_TANCI|nr:RNA-directed DNA polymerase, eukaryota, reverse transcriptase zinc-binding domain protein [Tanacetum cinerariifolium]
METLHLSFQKVVNARLFKGVTLDSLFQFTHLFYADDVVFVGVKVGGRMSSINSWDEIINKLLQRLSKWKMKTLSIGGRDIKTIHGEDGKLDKFSYSGFSSIWVDIVRDISLLKNKWIDLLGLVKKNVGNEENTKLWEETWKGSGDYLVVLVRNLLDDHNLHVIASKTRWNKVVLIKINILAWRVKLDNLPTRLNLSLRGMELDSTI